MPLQFLSCFACKDVGTHSEGLNAAGGEFLYHSSSAGNCFLSADTTTKKYGAASLKVSRASGDSEADFLEDPGINASQDDQALGFWVHVPTGGFPTATFAILFGYSVAGYCALGSDQKLRILDFSGQVRATMDGTLSADTWYWVVFRMHYREAGGSGTDFWLRLYSDEGALIEEISVASFGANPQSIIMGQRTAVAADLYFTYYLDGGYGVAGGWPPICPAFVDGMVPTGAGNYAEWSIFPDGGEDPYEDVDDVPDDADTTYLHINLIGKKHTFVHGASGIPGGESVLAVGLRAMCRNTDSFGLSYALMRLGTTDLVGTVYDTGAVYRAGKTNIQTLTKPGGGAWSITDVDNVEIGVQSLVYLSQVPRCTSVVLYAAYGPMDIKVWAVAAAALAAVPLLTVVTAAPVTISAVTAGASAAALLPTIVAVRNPTILAVTATCKAVAADAFNWFPTVAISEDIEAVVSVALAAALLPTITTVRNPTVEVVAATASAAVPLPSVAISETIAAVVAAAGADALLPTIATVRNPTVLAVAATAAAAAPLATIVTTWTVTVSAVTAQAPASAPLPTITTTWTVTVSGVTAVAVAASPLPSVAISEVIVCVVAEATAEAPLPSVAVSEIIQAVAAQAVAAVPLSLVAISEVIAAVSAIATAAAGSPTITTTWTVTMLAVVAQADARVLLHRVPVRGAPPVPDTGHALADAEPGAYAGVDLIPGASAEGVPVPAASARGGPVPVGYAEGVAAPGAHAEAVDMPVASASKGAPPTGHARGDVVPGASAKGKPSPTARASKEKVPDASAEKETPLGAMAEEWERQ